MHYFFIGVSVGSLIAAVYYLYLFFKEKDTFCDKVDYMIECMK